MPTAPGSQHWLVPTIVFVVLAVPSILVAGWLGPLLVAVVVFGAAFAYHRFAPSQAEATANPPERDRHL